MDRGAIEDSSFQRLAEKEESLFWRRLSIFLPHVLLVGCPLILFWRMIAGETVPGFRDSAEFYYPLFQWIDAQWASGQIPFWNPYDNFGTPVIEDGSTSIFYPLKAIFFARALPFASRFGIFLFAHVLLAAYGAYFCARQMRAGVWGATIAGLSFSLSGTILFQVCNVIFLASAAWLPWSLGCWWRLYVVAKHETKAVMKWRRQFLWILATSCCLAMMVLAGDPQMAYHSALLGFAICLASWWCQASHEFSLRNCLCRYAIVGVFSILLCVVQLWPSIDYARFSERTRTTGQPPRSLVEAAAYLAESNPDKSLGGVSKGLFGEPDPRTHSAYIYEFSQPSWTVLQLIWPNFNGKYFPTYQRWTLPFETERIWNLSIFMGIIPLLLAVSGFTFRMRQRAGRREAESDDGVQANAFLTCTILFFFIASLGGLTYWLLVVLLPGYVSFRFPAKLVVVVTLTISLLAGRQCKPEFFLQSYWQTRLAGFLAGVTLLVGVYANIPTQLEMGHYSFRGFIRETFDHPIQGPIDVNACYITIMTGAASTVVASCLFIWFCRRLRNGRAGSQQTFLLMTCLVAAELMFANGWMLLPVKSEVVNAELDGPVKVGQRWGRCFDRPEFPIQWWDESSHDRLSEVLAWNRKVLLTRSNLSGNASLVGAPASIAPSWNKFDFEEEIAAELAESSSWAQWLLNSNDPAIGKTVYGICGDSKEIERSKFKDWPKVDTVEDGIGFYRNPKRVLQPDTSTLPVLAAWDAANTDFEAAYAVNNVVGIYYFVEIGSRGKPLYLTSTWAPGWKAQANCRGDRPNDWRELPLSPHSPSTTRIDCSSLTPGQYVIRLKYEPRGFWVLAWVSLFGWGFVIASIVFVLGKRFVKSRM